MNKNAMTLKTLAVAMAAIGLAQPALAVLDSAGPVDPVNGFPQWYLDRNGVALELCVNNNATVLAAGGCVILPAAPPAGVQTVPEVFPNNWALEHFYTLASANITAAGLNGAGVPAAGAGKITFNLSLEGSFSTPVPPAGQQIAFNRWRVFHVNPPCTGNYTYYTPNNAPQTFFAAAGSSIRPKSELWPRWRSAAFVAARAITRSSEANIEARGGGISQPARPKDSTMTSRRRR